MKTRIAIILTCCLTIGVLGFCQVSKGDQELTPTPLPGGATPLAACQSVPPNLSHDLRRLYDRLCSTNIEERSRTLIDFPQVHASEKALPRAREAEMAGGEVTYIQHSEIIAFLPLLSEIMATDDSEMPGRGIYYLASHAAVRMAGAGGDAVPFVIKALKSRKPVELHAGLICAQRIVQHMEWTGETNDLPTVCSNLLPYVTAQVTNEIPETVDEAKKTERELRRFLPSPPSKEK